MTPGTASSTDRPLTGLYAPRPRTLVIRDLVSRARSRLDAMDDEALVATLEDALFHERKRLERAPSEPETEQQLDTLTEALMRGDRARWLAGGTDLVRSWADEIHGRFSMRAYRFASTVFPPALAGLLTAQPEHVRDWSFRVEHRVEVEGDVQLLRRLAQEATLILAPTHVSNLDSPLLGLALTLAGLPPFQYGAGLNLFSNPVLGWWMRRLGAYTVDRTKRAALYKDVLKDYSVYQLTHRHHSLFFPGGTRSRSGALESRVKKGLLGTGLQAWQEMLAAGRPDAEVYVVPVTLSFQLTLEANTLIDDHLADAGKQRYIITDDEFAQPRRVAQFIQRVLSLDSSAIIRFGEPLDVLGRPVPRERNARAQAAVQRRDFVCDRDGTVQWDAQRDRIYTEQLADALVEAYPRLATLLPTHTASAVAWGMLCEQQETTDPFRIVRSTAHRRRLSRAAYLDRLGRALARAREGAAEGRWHIALPDDPATVLGRAVEAFGRYHRSLAVAVDGDHVVVEDPRLCLYYRNRTTFADLEGA